MRSPGDQNYIREGRGDLKVFLSLLLGTVATPTPDSCSLLTLNEKKNMVYLGDGVVWSQELRDPLDQPNITFSKHVTPRKKVKTLSHRWNTSFSSVLWDLNVDCGQTEVLTCSPTPYPQPGEETQGIWLADVRGKAGIWQQWLLLGCRT